MGREPGPAGACVVVVAVLMAPAPAQGAGKGLPPGQLTERVACLRDPTQTYTLYLPSGYAPGRRWPALLVFDPRGRGTLAARVFLDAAQRYGWLVLSSDDTRSDVVGEDPNPRALQALWSEVHLRYATDERRVYAAGFSGGAMLALRLGEVTGKLAGIIASGGRIPDGKPVEAISFAHFAAAGRRDFNFRFMREVDELVARHGRPHRWEAFEGAHQWMPPELAEQAVAWMEILALQQGLRPPDDALLEAVWRGELSRIDEDEARGDLVGALRRTTMLVKTFDGLRDTATLRQRAALLEKNDALRRQEKRERDLDRRAQRQGERLAAALAGLDGPEGITSTEQLARAIGIEPLRQQARRPGYEGESAQRVLESAFVQLAFYGTREAFRRHDYARALLLLQVALRIHDDNATAWYNLAAARARSGQRRAALEALERAVKCGFAQAEHALGDADLESLRTDERFRELVEAMRKR